MSCFGLRQTGCGQVINVCRNANDIDIEKTLFKEVDHPLLREQIVKDAPELAEERGVR